MQNKKSLLKRLLFLYIALFLVIVTGIIHSTLGDFSRGAATGMKMGEEMAEMIQKGTPHLIYLLNDVRVIGQPDETHRINSGRPPPTHASPGSTSSSTNPHRPDRPSDSHSDRSEEAPGSMP